MVRSPVEICLGTRPSQAAKSRSLQKTSPVPIAATIALEMSGPMPGMLISRSHPESCLASSAISPDNSSMRSSSRRQSAAKPLMIRTMRGERTSECFLLRHVRSLSCLQSVDQDLGGRTGRGRVLTSDQETVLDRVDTPVFDLGIDRAEAEQLVLDKERHDLGQADVRLLTVCEPGHVLAID